MDRTGTEPPVLYDVIGHDGRVEVCNRAQSEMFGYERGAFTSAVSTGKKGLSVMADREAVVDGPRTPVSPSGAKALKPTAPPEAWTAETDATLTEPVRGYEGRIIDAAISRHGSKRNTKGPLAPRSSASRCRSTRSR